MKAGMVEGRERGVANAGGGAARRGRSRLEATVDMGGEGMSCIEGYGLESVARRQAEGVGWSEGNGLVVRSPLPISGREKARAWEAGGALVGGVCRGMREVAKKIKPNAGSASARLFARARGLLYTLENFSSVR